MSDFLKVFGPITLLVAASFWLAYQFVDPAPPRSLTLATGSPEGAYHAFGQRYKALLAEDGIDVRLVNTAGSVENMAHLGRTVEGEDAAARVDIAFVQSGIGSPQAAPDLVSLGSLYFEPLWVFVRGEARTRRLTELAGKRLAVGAKGSGTRDVALQLLAENDLGEGQPAGTAIQPLGGKLAADALMANEVDAAFFVTAHENPNVRRLITAPDIHLMTFDRAAAYERRFRHLSHLPLPEGVLDLAGNLPDQTLNLLSPVATLVAREDVHPALVDLMLRAATRIHGAPGLFQEPGQFPSPLYVDFPLSAEAQRYYKSGLPFLRRVLPFWAATIVERLWVMILPILTLMIPLLRIAPPTYRWQIRRRIVRWYRDLISLEEALAAAAKADDRQRFDTAVEKLERLQSEVGQVTVPLSYTADLYQLRTHIDFVRRRFVIAERGPAHGAVDITA